MEYPDCMVHRQPPEGFDMLWNTDFDFDGIHSSQHEMLTDAT